MTIEDGLKTSLSALATAIQLKLVELGPKKEDGSALAESIIRMLANGKTQEQIWAEVTCNPRLSLSPDDLSHNFTPWLFEQIETLNAQMNDQAAAPTGSPEPDAGGGEMDMAMGADDAPRLLNISTKPSSVENRRDKHKLDHISKAVTQRRDALHRVQNQNSAGRIDTHGRAPPRHQPESSYNRLVKNIQHGIASGMGNGQNMLMGGQSTIPLPPTGSGVDRTRLSLLEDQLAEKASIIAAQEQVLIQKDSFILTLQTRMFHLQNEIKELVGCRRAAEDHHAKPTMQEQLRRQISMLKKQLKDRTQLENDLEAIEAGQLGISLPEVISRFDSIQGLIEDACASFELIDIPDLASNLGHDKTWSDMVVLWAEMGSGLTIPNLIRHCLDIKISNRRLTRLLVASALCNLVFGPIFPALLSISSPLIDQYRRQILNKFGHRELYKVDSLAHKALKSDGFFKSSTFREKVTWLQNTFSHHLQWLLGSQHHFSEGPEMNSQTDEDTPPSVADAFKQTLKASLKLKVELMVTDVYYLPHFFKPGDLFNPDLMNYDGTVFADPATKRQRKTRGRSEQHTPKNLVTLCIFPAIYTSPRGIRTQKLREESGMQACVVDYTNFLSGKVSDGSLPWILISKATVLVHHGEKA